MRALMLLPICLVAACSGGGEEKAEKAKAPAALPAGQWEATYETENIRSTDKTEPALKAAAGEKETASACVREGAAPVELLGGPGYECGSKNSYMRNGRLNVSLQCRRDGIDGELMMTVSGNYTADTLDATIDTTAYLPGRGDFEMRRKITARKTGDTCTAPAEGDAANASGNASGG